MSDGSVEYTIRIAAQPETVWSFLVEPGGLAQWWGTADVDPRPGGRFRVEMHEGPQPIMSGTIIEIVPYERLVVTFGWEDTPAAPALAPGSSHLEISLSRDGDSTILMVRHDGLPPDLIAETRRGWEDYLGRLQRCIGPS